MLLFRGTGLLFHNKFLNAPLSCKVSSLFVAVVHIPSRPGRELQQLQRGEVDWVSESVTYQKHKRNRTSEKEGRFEITSEVWSPEILFNFWGVGYSNSMFFLTGADETTTPGSSRHLLISGLWGLEDLRLGRGKQRQVDGSLVSQARH